MTQDEIDNNIMESDLYYIFENNFGTHSQDPDLDRTFIGDLIEYFERRLYEIDNYIVLILLIYKRHNKLAICLLMLKKIWVKTVLGKLG
mgnify:CR=1 FL=1